MHCQYCGYPKVSVIKVWADKEGTTHRRFGCLACGRKFDLAESEKPARGPASRLSKHAKR
jgi:transcriptional regulator NrdR family protein